MVLGGLSTSTLVRVNVKDVNDNFPEFSPTSYDVTIGYSHPLNEVLDSNSFKLWQLLIPLIQKVT